MAPRGRFEVISIGNELLNGRTTNTNLTWLCKKLTFLGVNVVRAYIVSDDVKEIVDIVHLVLSRKNSDWIITSGGLGPTHDDITLASLAQALGRGISLNTMALEMIKEKTAKLKLTDTHRKMAFLPQGALPLRNPVGMAPAVYLEESKTKIVCLPGVPTEMEAIAEEFLFRSIKKEYGSFYFTEGLLRIQGLQEANLAPIILGVFREHPEVYIKSHPLGEGIGIELSLTTTTSNLDTSRDLVTRSLEEVSALILSKGGSILSSHIVDHE